MRRSYEPSGIEIVERRTYAPEELADKLSPIIDDICSVYQPERIILFGSAAQGSPWHDLDLMVVAKTEDRFFDRLKKIALAKRSWIPADIMVFTPDELRQAIQEDRVFIVEEVLKKGKTVYERGGRRGVA